MTQVFENVDFGPYHNRVIDLVNTMSGLAPESLGKLAIQFEKITHETYGALGRARQAMDNKPWSYVKDTLTGLMKVYCTPGNRFPFCVNRETLDLALGAAYFAALAIMAQELIQLEDFERLTRPCREANIPEISSELLTHYMQDRSLLTA